MFSEVKPDLPYVLLTKLVIASSPRKMLTLNQVSVLRLFFVYFLFIVDYSSPTDLPGDGTALALPTQTWTDV